MRVSKHTTAKVFCLAILLAASTALAQIPPYAICPSRCDNPSPCGNGRCADEDHDGLCDSWEVAGGIDTSSIKLETLNCISAGWIP